jgi:hypothetical protein
MHLKVWSLEEKKQFMRKKTDWESQKINTYCPVSQSKVFLALRVQSIIKGQR